YCALQLRQQPRRGRRYPQLPLPSPDQTDTRPAIAPRVALVLPSADQIVASGPLEAREKSYGYELLLPVSKIVSDRVTLNGNAGLRSFFDVAGHQPTTYRLGGS